MILKSFLLAYEELYVVDLAAVEQEKKCSFSH